MRATRYERRERNLGSVELAFLEHALVAVRAVAQAALLAYLHYVEGETRRLFNGPIMERHQPIVAIDSKGDAHSLLLAVVDNALIADHLDRDLLRVELISVGTTGSFSV